MLSSSYRTISATLTAMMAATVMSFLPQEVRAENKISATGAFRATIDSGVGGGFSGVAGASGSVVIRRQGAKQSFAVDVRNLAGSNYGVFRGDTFSTNYPTFFIAALNRRGGTNNSWNLEYASTSGAPPQLGVADVTNLADKIIYIATPGTTNITGAVTNLVGCTTNIVGGVTNLVGCTTNIIGSVTNVIVGAVLWAPIPDFSAHPGKESFKETGALEPPVSAPPSPRSHGSIKVQFVGARGRSVLDMRAKIPGGHEYTVWMIDGLGFTNNIGSLALLGANGRFIRDTGKGQPLPLQAREISALSSRGVLIFDEFSEVVLEGEIP